LIALLLLVTLTSPDHPPKGYKYFCFIGFFVSITWISIIADEVVNLLQSFGIILGISEAMIGLTVFAVVCLHTISFAKSNARAIL
jgi:sodium/potassium/calcium exchanger 6